MKFLSKLTAATLAVSGILLASAANAQQVITPGSPATPPPTAGPFGGTLINSLTQPFAGTFGGNSIAGTVISGVYDPDNDLTTANLDFYYQIISSGSNVNISSANLASFFGFTTAVAQTPDGDAGTLFSSGTEASIEARRAADGEGVIFDFIGFANGETSFTMIVRTNANSNTAGSVGINGSGVGTTASILAPLAVGQTTAPEPATLALLGMGMLGGIAARRRNKK